MDGSHLCPMFIRFITFLLSAFNTEDDVPLPVQLTSEGKVFQSLRAELCGKQLVITV